MAHIVFVHGILNKPPKDVLLKQWQDALREEGGIDTDTDTVSASMVYWADVVYAEPDTDGLDAGSAGLMAEVRSVGAFDEPLLAPSDKGEQDWLTSLAARIEPGLVVDGQINLETEPGTTIDWHAPDLDDLTNFEAEIKRIPVPWFFKRKFLKIFLKDVHHYLFNAEFSPRPGVTYKVQDEIRGRVTAALEDAAGRPGPLIMVGHSMGSIIAYDCLKRVPGCPKVDALITIGAPLGLDEVQDKLRPEWNRENGYPAQKVAAGWANIYDPLDIVAGADPKLANDYKSGGQRIVADGRVSNDGWWRHSADEYLARAKFRAALSDMLN